MRKLPIIRKIYPSGFKANVIIRPDFKKKFMGIIVDFGGSDPQKLSGGAHFLEHKLYAKKDGDISQKIEDLNASTNAFTSYNETMFYVEFLNHWRQLLPLLFELVGMTYFTKENVTKESQIISQELAMYQDDPSWQVTHNLLQRMYPATHLAEDLTGNQTSIKEMTPQILKDIYRKNYYSGNMQFVACGGFSEGQAKSILREVGKLQKKYFKVKKKKLGCSDKIESLASDNAIIKGNVSVPLIGVGIKLPSLLKINQLNFGPSILQILLEMMLQSRLGSSSSWFETAQREGIINSPLSINVTYTRQGSFVTILGASNKPHDLLTEIKRQLRFGKSLQSSFNLQKKSFIARNIRELDQIDDLAIEEAEMALDNETREGLLKMIQSVSFKEFCQIYENIFGKSEIFTTVLESEE